MISRRRGKFGERPTALIYPPFSLLPEARSIHSRSSPSTTRPLQLKNKDAQSLHLIVTTLHSSGGTGCNAIPIAIASHVGFIRSCVSAVFLHIGQRESWLANSRKQCQWIACPHDNSWLASRLEKRSSWHTGQLLIYLPTLQLCPANSCLSIHIPQSWQWRKFSPPPTRQKPQSGQW